MRWLEKKKAAAPVVQTRQGERHPFGLLEGYVPLKSGEIELYRCIREAVPIVDAAVDKLVRLAGGVKVSAGRGPMRSLRSWPQYFIWRGPACWSTRCGRR